MTKTAYLLRTQSLMSVQMNIRVSSGKRNLSSQVYLCRIMPLLKAIEKIGNNWRAEYGTAIEE